MPKLRVIIKPPPEPQGDAEQQTEALRDYLLQMSEELAYVLTHLEADNINDSTFERIQGMIPRPYTGLPVMDGDASSGQSEGWARGDHRHPKDTSKADVTALATETAAREAHEADTGNPHSVTAAQVGLGNVANERQYSAQNPPPIPTPGEVGAIPTTEKGSAGGVAELDANGMVPSAQLPSYVDDVLEYASLSDFPVTGESGKIYVALDTNRTYRWSGSAYVEISESLALGETSSTAYRGDRGKIAYDHSQVTSGNPHNVTAAEVGLGNVANERQYSAQNPPPLPTPADIGAATAQDLTDHVGDTNNPHSVTAAQVGVVPNPAGPATDTLTKMQVGSTVYEITGGGGGGPEPATATPLMDRTGAVGSSLKYAREDHEHPADTNKQDTITASGILKGDGQGGVSAATAGTDFQAPLTIDATPTANSTNPVQSGGVYTDVRTRVPNYGKGKNLLRNWYFVGGGTGRGVFPVNQRGQSSYGIGVQYSVDGWYITYGSYGVNAILNQTGLSIGPVNTSNHAYFQQYIDNAREVIGMKVTGSVLTSDGYLLSGTVTVVSSNIIKLFEGNLQGTTRIWYNSTNSIFMIEKYGSPIEIAAIKLELGTEQTLAHQENGVWVLNDVPDYEYELYRCITSTADSSDTYANKSLATRQDLTSIQATGTTNTTGAAIPAGTYFYLNGILHRAKTQIDQNATFTINTNCEQAYAAVPSCRLVSVTFNCDSSGRHTFSNGELPNRALSSPVGCLAKDASNNYLNAGAFDINPRYTTAGTFVSSSCANKEVTLFFAVYN